MDNLFSCGPEGSCTPESKMTGLDSELSRAHGKANYFLQMNCIIRKQDNLRETVNVK